MEITLKNGEPIVLIKKVEIVDNSAFLTGINGDVYEEYIDDIKTITP